MSQLTLADGLKSSSVNFEILHKQYHPVLALVKELIGVIPACDPILEIWPAGFRSYNILVPNMFNLPQTIFGSKALKASMGLAMYTSSRAAECPYCSAHTASFALRRGATPAAVGGVRNEKEEAVVSMAEAMSRVPALLTRTHVEHLKKYFSPEDVEVIACSISMMGFLNKFMDAVGVELEQEAINDVADLISKNGWTPGKHLKEAYRTSGQPEAKPDNLLTYLRVIRQAPGALLLEKKWMAGVPDTYAEASAYLAKHTGYSFPVLKGLSKKRMVRALTKVICDNLDSEITQTGLKVKTLAGYLFALMLKNESLALEVKQITKHNSPELSENVFDVLRSTALNKIPDDETGCREWMSSLQQSIYLSEKEAAVLLLAFSASPSPASVNKAVIETTGTQLTPAIVVETIVWLSVLQLLHRLGCYFEVAG